MNRYFCPNFLLVSFLLSAGFAQAQSIAIDTASNWQQSISGILGGNCVEISHVQFSNHPGSAATFSGGTDIGLSEGIVLSTGQLTQQIDTTQDMFLSGIFNDAGGDSLLELYAIQEIGYTGNASSYDATRLEFDFVAPSTQEVNIRFVFASEEYPEFAPPNVSYFNDIFAFFVAESGSNSYTNIATVPGTSLPVTIGNINTVTNSEYYIENQGIDFAFNAYTSPISATFTAQAGIVYHLIIAISDIGDFNFDSAVFLELNSNSAQSIHGTAYAGLEPLSAGNVNLFGFNTDPGAFDMLQSVSTNASGDYLFADVEQGLYLIQVEPDNAVFPEALPIYYPGVVLWEEATAVGLSCDSLGMNGPGMILNSGPGMIAGIIGQDPFGGRLRSEGLIPYQGVNVFLQDSASLEWRGFDISDVNGEYNFQNLATGTYYVIPDVAGIPVLEPRKVVISESSPSADEINFQMNEDGVVNLGAGILQMLEAGSSVSWHVTNSNFYWLGNNAILKTGGDTLINDTLYTRILADGILTAADAFNPSEAELIGGFRQEGTRLYLRYLYEFGSVPYELVNRDMLYFDLQYQVGDTIRYPDIQIAQTGLIVDIDTFTLGGITRYRWEIDNISNSNDYNEFFVSGIGNSQGLFNLLAADNTAIDGFLPFNTCYTDINDQSYFAQEIYSSTPFGELSECFLMTGGFDPESINAVTIYPNPGEGLFTVQREQATHAQLIVRDLSGRVLHFQSIHTLQEHILADQLLPGMYLVEILEANRSKAVFRWICR